MDMVKKEAVFISTLMKLFRPQSMTQTKNRNRFIQRLLRKPQLLLWYFITVNLVPTFYFFFTEPLNIFGKMVILLLPFGLYLLIFSAVENIGKWQVFLFPLLFLHAFQIVLFYLFGRGVIAANMFLNVTTTNSAEVSELLGALLPSIIIVVTLYVPATILGIIQWRHRVFLSRSFRKRILHLGLGSLVIAFTFSFFSQNQKTGNFAFHRDIYPVNLFYNLGFATQKYYKTKQYPENSKDFTFEATRNSNSKNRQIIVLVVGETSRPDNWELFGYERENNPLLSKEDNLILYKDAITQSNVTHQSVPIILSGVGAENFKDLYHQKGIFEAFKETGFTTICLSNQVENGSFIEYIYKQADIYTNLKSPENLVDKNSNPPDEKLTILMEQKIAETPGDLFIVLHPYGSHFNYMDRYPESFRKYTPDNVTNVSKTQKEEMVNAYDNSILYTDYFLSQNIAVLEESNASSYLLFAADHGEDIFDDKRGKFLHSSPIPTYYQLRIAFLSWFSTEFKAEYPEKFKASLQNSKKPVSTNAVFHTLIDVADISTPFLKEDLSLVNPKFKKKKRVFLTDHENAIPYRKLNLRSLDYQMLKENHIAP